MDIRFLLVAATLAALGGPLGAPAFAGDAGHFDRAQQDEVADHRMNELFDRLGLTADQRQKIDQIRKRQLAATTEGRERLREKRKALLLVVRRADATLDQAQALQRDINALQAQLATARLAAWFEARAVLTPRQLEKLAAMPGPRERPPGSRR